MADQQPKRRLSQIKPKEVSLVDEAANNKRFITIKSKGGKVGKTNADILKSDEPNPTPNGDEANVQKVSAEQKQQAEAMLQAVVEKLMSVINSIKELPEGEPGPMPGELGMMVRDAAALLIRMIMPMPEMEDEGEGMGDGQEMNKSKDDDEEPSAALDFLSAANEDLAQVQKAGKKMSSARLNKLQSVISVLNALLEELGGSGVANTTNNKVKKSNKGGGVMKSNTNDQPSSRPLEERLKLADAEVIKCRDALADAEEKAEAEEITKAKESLESAQTELKKCQDEKAEAEKQAEIEKAQKEKDEAEAKLKKAKGENEEPAKAESKVLKAVASIGESVSKLAESVADIAKNQKATDERIEKMEKSAMPSNANSTDESNNSEDEEVKKNKEKNFWGGVFR